MRILFFSSTALLCLVILPILVWDFFIPHHRRYNNAALTKRAIFRTIACWSITAMFALGIFYYRGSEDSLLFFTGFILEYSLSVDNLFVFTIIMRTFAVNIQASERILGWGILATLILRWFFIFFGSLVLKKFDWVIFIFASILIYTAVKLGIHLYQSSKHDGNHGHSVRKNFFTKMIERIIPIDHQYNGHRFFSKSNGVLHVTPSFLALVMMIVSDVVCAFDSVPAIFAITNDVFIIYASNAFAVIGLRSLYVAIECVVDRFKYVEYGLVAILLFVGIKMCVNWIYHNMIPIHFTLVFIAAIMTLSIVFSLLKTKNVVQE